MGDEDGYANVLYGKIECNRCGELHDIKDILVSGGSLRFEYHCGKDSKTYYEYYELKLKKVTHLED